MCVCILTVGFVYRNIKISNLRSSSKTSMRKWVPNILHNYSNFFVEPPTANQAPQRNLGICRILVSCFEYESPQYAARFIQVNISLGWNTFVPERFGLASPLYPFVVDLCFQHASHCCQHCLNFEHYVDQDSKILIWATVVIGVFLWGLIYESCILLIKSFWLMECGFHGFSSSGTHT